MRCGVYARVSTADKNQDPETQLVPLREFVAVHGWTVAGEFADHASATDLRGRTQWQTVLQVASRRKIDLVLVWKLDRAFRSVLHASQTLEVTPVGRRAPILHRALGRYDLSAGRE